MSSQPGRGAGAWALVASACLALVVLVPAGIGGVWTGAHWDELVGRDLKPELTPIQGTEVVETTRIPARKLRIGVTVRLLHDQYDDIESLLGKMGAGYAYDRLALTDLADVAALIPYDVLFIGCAAEMASLDLRDLGLTRFSEISLFRDPAYLLGVRGALREYVEKGGSIYASDWAAEYLQVAFSDRIGFDRNVFPLQLVQARVLDPGLAEVIGQSLPLSFDKDLWICAARVHQGREYLEGLVRSPGGGLASRPLLVGFSHGKGQVLFTSFHNEKPDDRSQPLSDQARGLLEYLVFKQVTAGVSGEVSRILVSQNYALGKETLFSTGMGSPRTFQFVTRAGQRISFMLAWNPPHAGETAPILELEVRSPSGKVETKRGDEPPLVIAVDGSEPGAYGYAVHAVRVPWNNFPYVLQVGVKE